MTDAVSRDRPSPEERDALAGELIGAAIAIDRAPGLSLPLSGTIVDESMHTFVVRVPGKQRTRRISKAGLEATVLLGERSIRLKGDTLRMRPEDRTKRLMLSGRSGRD
jgi:RNase P/RNase MRP subunit p29